MNCTVEFDLLEAGFRHWAYVLSPIIFVFIGSALFLQGRRARAKLFGLLFTAIGALLLYNGYSGTYGSYKRYVQAYKSGNYSIAEGRVENFREEGVGVRRVKYGAVGEYQFEIRGAAYVTNGYNEDLDDPGPFSSGRYVKIWHINGKIIRLETCV